MRGVHEFCVSLRDVLAGARPRLTAACGNRLSQCPGGPSVCWTRGHRSHLGAAQVFRHNRIGPIGTRGSSVRPPRERRAPPVPPGQGDPCYTSVPPWLSPGDNAWQLTAATLVGLMSVPGLVVLYGGVMQKRWSINSMMLDVRDVLGRARRVGALGLQDGIRPPDRPRTRLLLDVPRQTRQRPDPGAGARTGEHPADQRGGAELQVPGVVARLLPVRVRGDHADPVAGLGPRTGEHQGVDSVHAPSGSRSCTRSTPSCSGAAAGSPTRGRSTSPVAT